MADIESLRKSLKGDIVTTSDPGYEEAIKRWANNAVRRAKYVAYVKDAQDVAAAIKWAKASHTPIAVRGGGHSPAGTSSVENGLVIDLSRYLNSVKIDPAKKLGYVGGGALWEHVDNAASEHGLAAVGGTVNHVSLPHQRCCSCAHHAHAIAQTGVGGYACHMLRSQYRC